MMLCYSLFVNPKIVTKSKIKKKHTLQFLNTPRPMSRGRFIFLSVKITNIKYRSSMPATYLWRRVERERPKRFFGFSPIRRFWDQGPPPNRYSNHIAVIKLPQYLIGAQSIILLLTRTVVKTPIQILVLLSQNSTFHAQDASNAWKVSGTMPEPLIFYSNMM